MAIVVPDRNDPSFRSLMEALQFTMGDDNNIVLMDLKNVEDQESDKTVQIALKIFETVSEPGQITALELNWGSEDWKIQASSTAASDTRQPRDTSPQFQYPEDREAAIESGAIKP